MKKKIYVVAAVINNNGKTLIAQRGGEGLLNNKWEFPGGKIEPGETIQQTIKREIKEELDIDIIPKEKIATTEYEYPFAIINITFISCLLNDDIKNITLNVHKDLRWIDKQDISKVDWAPADIEVLDKLVFIWNKI